MKWFFLSLILVSSSLLAEEKRSYKKLSPEQAEVVITTQEQESTQASTYVDGAEVGRFLSELFLDEHSRLFELKRQIEWENCHEKSSHESNQIPGCGSVEWTPWVMTSFGRGGWDISAASYTFFIGFRSEGTGRFFDGSAMVTLTEDVQAQTTPEGQYTGSVLKELELGKITRIPINLR